MKRRAGKIKHPIMLTIFPRTPRNSCWHRSKPLSDSNSVDVKLATEKAWPGEAGTQRGVTAGKGGRDPGMLCAQEQCSLWWTRHRGFGSSLGVTMAMDRRRGRVMCGLNRTDGSGGGSLGDGNRRCLELKVHDWSLL